MKLHLSNYSSLAIAVSTATSALQKNGNNLKNTSGQTLESGGASGTVAGSSSQNASSILSRLAQDVLQAQDKRLKDMQDAVAKLHAMPSPKTLAKSIATERAAMLKKIMEMMKQMMIGATPAQAKAMAAQLKSVAKELASLAKELSSGASAGTAMVAATANPESDVAGATDAGAAVPATAVEPEAAASATLAGFEATALAAISMPASSSSVPSPAATGIEAAETVTGASGVAASIPVSQFHSAQQAVAAYAAATLRNAPDTGKNGEEKAVDDGLRNALKDALKSLRELIVMLKSKIAASNKDMKEAENKMVELGRSLAQTESQDASASGVQGMTQEQVTQAGGAAEADAGTVMDSTDTAGGISSEIPVGDAGGAVGGNISVSV
ncbi:MAG: hypothetical protein PHG47_00435 [Sulfuricella sp.]|nr:hypothetical protein [Sulfuricella sp.]